MRLLGHVPDLLDRSRVSSAHPDAVFVADLDELVARASAGDVVVVDLGRPGVLDRLGGLVGSGARVVGFASHVDTRLIDAATAAGCEVLPRSRFFRDLPDLRTS
jgi:hypothetical protein